MAAKGKTVIDFRKGNPGPIRLGRGCVLTIEGHPGEGNAKPRFTGDGCDAGEVRHLRSLLRSMNKWAPKAKRVSTMSDKGAKKRAAEGVARDMVRDLTRRSRR